MPISNYFEASFNDDVYFEDMKNIAINAEREYWIAKAKLEDAEKLHRQTKINFSQMGGNLENHR
tara:strand:+ start:1275 stop:1466 length:192 start_codon:yes stop_codon:yes gene_type:complete